MADLKISQLGEVTDLQAGDEFVLARSSATKKITGATLSSFFGGGLGLTSYTPALTGSSSDPTLGSGSSAVGQYLTIGDLVVCWGRILFGTSGVGAGSGDYRISLPVNAETTIASRNSGSGFITDSGTVTNSLTTECVIVDATYFIMQRDGQTQFVGAASPFTWQASDSLRWFIAYPAA